MARASQRGGDRDRRRTSCCCGCSPAVLLLLSAVPIAAIISAITDASPSSFVYSGDGLFRECAKWDPRGRRFLASTFVRGSVVEIAVGDDGGGPAGLEERTVVEDADVAGNGTVGLAVDGGRGRVVVVYGDVLKGRFAAVGAYRLDSWERVFLTQLGGPGKFNVLLGYFHFNTLMKYLTLIPSSSLYWVSFKKKKKTPELLWVLHKTPMKLFYLLSHITLVIFEVSHKNP